MKKPGIKAASLLALLSVSPLPADAQLQGLFGSPTPKQSILLTPQITIIRQNDTTEILPPLPPATAGACLWDGANRLKSDIQLFDLPTVVKTVKTVRTDCKVQGSGVSVVSYECHPQADPTSPFACTDPKFASLQWQHALWRDIYSKKPEPHAGLGSLFQPR